MTAHMPVGSKPLARVRPASNFRARIDPIVYAAAGAAPSGPALWPRRSAPLGAACGAGSPDDPSDDRRSPS